MWALVSADKGAAMGSPVSPVIYNILEEMALQAAPVKPRVWERYVDDTYCIMDRRCTDSFLQHLNSRRDTIKFTMEIEQFVLL